MSWAPDRLGKFGGVAALAAGLFGSSQAWAQCTDNFNYATVNAPAIGQVSPISVGFPLGTGSTLSALTSTINTVNTAFLTQTTAFVSAPGNPQPDQQGAGVWARGIGGTVETSTTSTGILTAPAGAVPATGTQTCHTTTRQDYAGYQVGHDISILNGGGTGANWHWGVTAGYMEARTKDITPAGSFINPTFGAFNTPAGRLNEESQVPFAGIYTAFTKGGFFLDGQARWDFYQNTLRDPNNGLLGQELDARGFSLTGNTGYNMQLGSGWFLEPSGGVVFSRVQVDPLKVPGLQQTNGPFFFARGTVAVDDIESVLGRATLRIGTNFTSGGMAWQPFFTASVFHEFAGDVTVRSTPDPVLMPGFAGFQLTSSSSGGVGTYGQFALGTAAAIINTGWLGYARVDYRTGEDIEGWSVNAGLRYQFTPEQRASVKDGPAPALYAYNWTGPYIGAFAGMSWDKQDWETPFPGGARTHDHLEPAGYLVGGQAGYNVQFGRTVIGIEGDYGFSHARGGKACDDAGGAVTGAFDFTCQGRIGDLASLTGRLGYAAGRALFYVKGGLAAGDVTVQTSQNQGLPVPPTNKAVNGESDWLYGWTVGGGMEFALTDRWSAKAEYMHYDLGSDHFRVDSGLVAKAETEGNIVRIGLNLHFNPVQREVPLK